MPIAAPSLPPIALDGRRTDLDWIRIGAFALLILYHVGMFYTPDSWDWHAKSRWASEPLTLAMYITNPWRLGLLFLVSGAATRFMVGKLSAGALARSRTARLLPPLALGMLVVVPPQTYLEVLRYAGFSGSYPEFYVRYLAGPGFFRDGDRLITPTWNHLWFVTYLWVYTLVLAGLLAASPKFAERLEHLAERAFSGWGVLVWPWLWLAAARLLLAPVFEQTHALIDDWYNHVQYLALFLFGFTVARNERVWAALDRVRRPAVLIAGAAYLAWSAYAWSYRGEAEPSATLSAGMALVYAADQWAWIVAILAYGRRWLSGRDGPVRRYLTDAIFPFYIIHQTAVVVFGYGLTRLDLPAPVEAGVLIALTALACVATYELVRRVGWLRPVFGLKRPTPPAGTVGATSGVTASA
jgi:hypothetical protein